MNHQGWNIRRLGACTFDSPLLPLLASTGCQNLFIKDDARVVFTSQLDSLKEDIKNFGEAISLEQAGPRDKIFFNPQNVRAAVVTCGGLCPGINDVIRGLVMTLHYRYGVKEIMGIRYGYQGFIPEFGHEVINLTPTLVANIHKEGGSILSTSRGYPGTAPIVDFLQAHGIKILFVIGGDGTMRSALEIAEAAEAREVPLSIIGIPKTIDNDILYIDQSFGFETAFSEAVEAIRAANIEALGAPNGVGLVKLMGRHSGFIACYAAMAETDVNYVLIPEVPFELDGPRGFLNHLEERLKRRRHAVIVAAEGAAQDLVEGESKAKDASGNVRFKDVGLFLKDRINAYFKDKMEVNVKYIDPSYMIRGVKANPQDSVYCMRLGQNAVHAAMTGRTRMVVGLRLNKYVHLPMEKIAEGRKRVNPHSDLWLSVLEATGQPVEFRSQ